MSRVRKLYLRPASRLPVKEVDRVVAVAGQGLEGDHAGGGKRQITLIDAEAWRDACAELGADVDPKGRRANVLVEGIRLADTIGSRLHIGPCTVEVIGETAPCELMDDFHPGLKDALKPDRRGGVYGRILAGGAIEVGSPVELAPASE